MNLGFLLSHNHNFIRLWAGEQPHSWNHNLDQLERYFVPFPWQRTGPGTANDGKPQFDFTKFDQSFFAAGIVSFTPPFAGDAVLLLSH